MELETKNPTNNENLKMCTWIILEPGSLWIHRHLHGESPEDSRPETDSGPENQPSRLRSHVTQNYTELPKQPEES